MSNMHNPAHPGEVLREYLPEGVSIGEVAKRLGVIRQALSALLNGRAGVSASMAPGRTELGPNGQPPTNAASTPSVWPISTRRLSSVCRLAP